MLLYLKKITKIKKNLNIYTWKMQNMIIKTTEKNEILRT